MKYVTRLKDHLNIMQKELDYTNKQIKLFEKNHSISEWDNIDGVNGKSIGETEFASLVFYVKEKIAIGT